jgi:ribonuclease HI
MLGKGQYGQVCKAKLVSEAKSKTAKIFACKIMDVTNIGKKELDNIKLEFKKYIIIGNNSYTNKYILNFDGCSKGNPGPSGAGGVIYKNGKEILSYSVFLGNNVTNNESEYKSLSIGIDKAIELNIKKLIVKGDSQLVINQVLGKYMVNNKNLKEIYNLIKRKIKFFDDISFNHVYRNNNKRADELSNNALN